MPPLRIAHVMNQFYAGVGGEAHADMPLEVRPGPLGAGIQLQRAFAGSATVVATLVMGDNWAHDDPDQAVARVVKALAEVEPDGVLLGPTFGSGRYGITCGRVGAAAVQQLGLRAVVAAMHPENPGYAMFRRHLVVVPTTQSAAGMADALAAMARLALRLMRGEELGAPEVEGYLPRGLKQNLFHEAPAADRAVAMLLDKLGGRPFATEVALPRFTPVPPPPKIARLEAATIAMVTTGGVVPKGNPDRMESRRASKWGRYPLDGLTHAGPDRWESVHGGFDNHYLNDDPNRVLPLDVLRELEGRAFGRLFPEVISTVGSMMSLETSEAFGRDIARALAAGQVDGVLLAVT
jgi:glycine reductase complex component B subunit gamma